MPQTRYHSKGNASESQEFTIMDRDIIQGRVLLEMGRISEQVLTNAYNSGQCSPSVDLCQVLLHRGYLDPQSAHQARHSAALQSSNKNIPPPPSKKAALKDRPPLSPEEISGLWQSTFSGTPLESLNPNHTMRNLKTPTPTIKHSQESGFQFISELGRGGMGLVYKAFQKTLQREVAVKKILPNQSNFEVQQAFISESLVSAALDHPGVAPIYDLVTSPTGELELAMKVVTGQSWKDILHPDTPERKALSEKRSQDDELNTLSQLCNTLAFAHDKGIAHCDLKPENVMIGQFGEVYLMDWGIAVSFDPKANHLARSKESVSSPCGTPRYMAPELADGSGEEIGPWTDVFLLGAILHEILLGIPPHKGDSFIQIVIAASRSGTIEMPKRIPEELQRICQTAMNRLPGERYSSVLDFQRALKDYLTHKESHQISENAHQLLNQCLERQRGVQLNETLTQSLYKDFAQSVASFQQALELWPENEVAASGKNKASLLYGQAAFNHGDLLLAKAQISSLQSDKQAQDLRADIDNESARRRNQARRVRLQKYVIVSSVVVILIGLSFGLILIQDAKMKAEEGRSAAIESKKVALLEKRKAEDSNEEAQRQKDRANKELVRNNKILAESFCQVGLQQLKEKNNLFAQLYFAKAISYHDTVNYRGHYFACLAQNRFRKLKTIDSTGGQMNSRTISTAGTGLNTKIFAMQNKKIVVYSLNGKILRQWKAQERDIAQLKASADGQFLISYSVGGTMNLWDPNTGQKVKQLLDHAPSTHPVSINRDGSLISYYHAKKKSAMVWSRLKKLEIPLFENILGIRGVANSRRLIVYKNFNSSQLFNVVGTRHKQLGKPRFFQVATIDENSGNLKIFCKENSNSLTEYRHSQPGFTRPFRESLIIRHQNYLHSDLSGDGKTLATLSASRLKIWNIHTGELIGQLFYPNLDLLKVSLNLNGTIVTALDSLGKIHNWQLSPTPTIQLQNPDKSRFATINSFTFGKDGSLFLLINSNSIIQYDPNTKKIIRIKSGPKLSSLSASNEIPELAFMMNGQPILYNLNDRSFSRPPSFPKISASIDYFGSQLLIRKERHKSHFILYSRTNLNLQRNLVYDYPRAKRHALLNAKGVFFFENYNKIHFSPSKAGSAQQTLAGHKHEIISLAVSRNGTTLISADRARKVYIWDYQTGKLLYELKGHQFTVTAVTLTEDGRYALTADINGRVFLWRIKSQSRIAKFEFSPGTHIRLTISPDGQSFAHSNQQSVALVNLGDFYRLEKASSESLYQSAQKDTGLTFVGAEIQPAPSKAKQ